MSRTEKKVWATVLAISVAYVIFVAVTEKKIPCFFYTNFGVKCPGCGVTRMFVSMLKLDFCAAFWFNPVMFILFFVWACIAILYIWGRFKIIKNIVFLKYMAIISLVIAAIFGIVRNFL